MSQIRPFAAIRYARRAGLELSGVIAPPFDVQDDSSKAALQARHPHNIVNVDLPHIPPKAAGPAEKYDAANITFQSWLDSGVLVRDRHPAFYPYRQTFELHGRTYHRRGFYALVRLSPFGQGQVVPHEKTYKGAIEDRLALMRATQAQLSPIFGLFNDRNNEVTNLLYQNLGRPEQSGTLDGVQHDLWSQTVADIETRVIDLMGTKPVYIADGHHRYTTALAFQQEAIAIHGGPLPPNHPANFCMFVLVSTNDPGLLIQPTHRIIGGLEWFDIDAFTAAVGDNAEVTKTIYPPERLDEFATEVLPKAGAHTFGLYDGRTRILHQVRLKNLDVLKPLEPNQSDAWRRLDVAILQRYLLDEVIQVNFVAEGKELTKSYTADPKALVTMTDGTIGQIALLLQSTPLHALEELGKFNEVMPQKSTYFYPKLATGVIVNSLSA